jgi:hypothetical protein
MAGEIAALLVASARGRGEIAELLVASVRGRGEIAELLVARLRGRGEIAELLVASLRGRGASVRECVVHEAAPSSASARPVGDGVGRNGGFRTRDRQTRRS